VKNYIGTDGFVWAIGVVENRLDPKKSGRLQVRILGAHSEDKRLVPTAELQWAQVISPTSHAGSSGIGTSPPGIVEGAWVILFFLDGSEQQHPVVWGVLSGIPEKFVASQIPQHPTASGISLPVGNSDNNSNNISIIAPEPVREIQGDGEIQSEASAGNLGPMPGTAEFLEIEGKKQDPVEGFLDQRLKTSEVPGLPRSVCQTEDGLGTTHINQVNCPTYPYFFNEPDTNRLARNANVEATIVQKKLQEIQIGQQEIPAAHCWQSPSAGSQPIEAIERNGTENTDVSEASGRLQWQEPETKYAAVYPYNKVSQTESGHTVEFDDTPGAERIHVYHRTGTFIEIHPDGSCVTKVVNDMTSIVLKNKFEHIENVYWLTVDKGCKFHINKDSAPGNDFDIEIGKGGGLNITVNSGDIHLINRNGNLNTYINGNKNETITGDLNQVIGGSKTQEVHGRYLRNVKGPMDEYIGGEDFRKSGGPMFRRAPKISLN